MVRQPLSYSFALWVNRSDAPYALSGAYLRLEISLNSFSFQVFDILFNGRL